MVRRGPDAPYKRPRTAVAMRTAAPSRSSCSHTRMTSHPSFWSVDVLAASRSLFRSNLADQNADVNRSTAPWSGQPCQKQPSTKTATRERGKTMSGRGAPRPWPTRRSTKNRSPARCSARLSRISGTVSLRRLPRSCAVRGLAELAGFTGVGCPARWGSARHLHLRRRLPVRRCREASAQGKTWPRHRAAPAA